MSIMFLLIGCSVLIAAGFLVAFLWSVKNGQYDDTYTPSVRMLFDDEEAAPKDSQGENRDANERLEADRKE